MKRLLKILWWSGAALGALLILLAATLLLRFDPDSFQDTIATAVKEHTGRDLRIGGRIRWTFFPRLGLEASDLVLGNARGFEPEPFARVEVAGVRVRLAPLLRGVLAVDALYLHGLTLHLARDRAGRSNWEDLLAASPAAPAPGRETAPIGMPLAALTLGRLELQRATIRWHDRRSDTVLALRELALETGRFALGVPLDLKLGFVLEYGQPPERLPVDVRAELLADSDRIELNRLDARLGDTRLAGRFALEDLTALRLRFDLALDRLDLDQLLPTAPAAGAAAPAAAAAPALPLAAAPTLEVDGRLTIAQLKAFGLRVSELHVPVSARGGRIRLGPSRAKLYGGTHAGDLWIEARAEQPAFELHERLERVQLGALWHDAGLAKRFHGTGDLEAALTARGLEARALRQTLSGHIVLRARDGRIEGVDLQRLVREARARYDQARGKPQRVLPAAGDETVFERLHATLHIAHGIARADDLLLQGPVLRASGRGTIDLVHERLDYRLEVTLAEGAAHRGTTVPLAIQGPFAQLRYRVDLDALLGRRLEQRLEEKLERSLEKLFSPP